MKVKKFVAPSMPQVMKIIRSELGSDAIILNSEVVHSGGIFGLFKKRSIEVLAAVDSNIHEHPKQAPVNESYQKSSSHPVEKSNLAFEKEQIKNADVTVSKLSIEVMQLKEAFFNLAESSNVINVNYPVPIKKIQQKLAYQQIDKKIQQQLLKEMIERWYSSGVKAPYPEVDSWLNDILYKKISKYSFGGITFQKKFVNVIGPTGVGKTTTLAKIAAECVLKFNKKVAFITTDTYRIAAIDQLKTYSSILNVPLEVCYNLEDVKKASNRFNHFDLVLIDTAGRNFRDRQNVDDLKDLMQFNEEMETFLVLSLTTKQEDMEEIYSQISAIPIDRFIFTKADETATFGAMINLMMKYKKGVAYITNGQNVPDDIITAKPEDVIHRVVEVE